LPAELDITIDGITHTKTVKNGGRTTWKILTPVVFLSCAKDGKTAYFTCSPLAQSPVTVDEHIREVVVNHVGVWKTSKDMRAGKQTSAGFRLKLT